MSGRTDDPDENGLTNAMWNDIIRASYTENIVIQGAIEQAIVNAVKVASRLARVDELNRFVRYVDEAGLTVAFRELRGRLAELAAQND